MSERGPIVGGVTVDGVREVLDRDDVECAVLFGSRLAARPTRPWRWPFASLAH